jgi:hypothetical protein
MLYLRSLTFEFGQSHYPSTATLILLCIYGFLCSATLSCCKPLSLRIYLQYSASYVYKKTIRFFCLNVHNPTDRKQYLDTTTSVELWGGVEPTCKRGMNQALSQKKVDRFASIRAQIARKKTKRRLEVRTACIFHLQQEDIQIHAKVTSLLLTERDIFKWRGKHAILMAGLNQSNNAKAQARASNIQYRTCVGGNLYPGERKLKENSGERMNATH